MMGIVRGNGFTSHALAWLYRLKAVGSVKPAKPSGTRRGQAEEANADQQEEDLQKEHNPFIHYFTCDKTYSSILTHNSVFPAHHVEKVGRRPSCEQFVFSLVRILKGKSNRKAQLVLSSEDIYSRCEEGQSLQRRFEPRSSSPGELLRFLLELRSSGSPLGVLLLSLPPP